MNQFNKSCLETWGLDLVNKYPLIFTEGVEEQTDKFYPSDISLRVHLRYGFECKEGWFKIIDTISKTGTELVLSLRKNGYKEEEAYIHSCIVKEKFGTLRWQGFYKLPDPFDMLWRTFLVAQEDSSAFICEITGEYGKTYTTKNGGERAWHRTLCLDKAKELGYDTKEILD